MQLHQFDDVKEFWHCAGAYLLRHETENSVLLGVANTLLHNPARYPYPPYLAVVEANGDILAVALRTPPYKLLLSKAKNLDALTLVAQDLQDREQLPGVMGLVPEVETFLQTWQKLTGQSYQREVEMGIHQLTAVQSFTTANGQLRLATERDRPLLLGWVPAFTTEIGMVVNEDAEHVVDSQLKAQHIYLWEDNAPVSLATGRQFSPTAGRIGQVYTPPEYRRKGYATASVAALSQKLLDEGCNCCFLLTNLANSTSNHIYREIGYIPICDWHEYSFSSHENPG
jgi:uncharacterized protein